MISCSKHTLILPTRTEQVGFFQASSFSHEGGGKMDLSDARNRAAVFFGGYLTLDVESRPAGDVPFLTS